LTSLSPGTSFPLNSWGPLWWYTRPRTGPRPLRGLSVTVFTAFPLGLTDLLMPGASQSLVLALDSLLPLLVPSRPSADLAAIPDHMGLNSTARSHQLAPSPFHLGVCVCVAQVRSGGCVYMGLCRHLLTCVHEHAGVHVCVCVPVCIHAWSWPAGSCHLKAHCIGPPRRVLPRPHLSTALAPGVPIIALPSSPPWGGPG
jgi:hypothetical protein